MKPKTKPKTKQQIILETVAYYGADPARRGVLESGTGYCAYVTSQGQMCAIGRLLTDAGLKVYYLDHTFVDEIEPKYIRPEYREALADPEFAADLQHLHDTPEYWNDEGLTEDGRQELSNMLDRWSN